MATVAGLPAPLPTEDSAVRFKPGRPDGLLRKLDKATYVLVDGPNVGETVEYVVDPGAGSGGGGGGGAVTVANGADVAEGATTDAESASGNGSVIALLKRIRTQVTAILAKQPALGTAGSSSTDVITVQGIASGTAQAVSGTVTANAGTGTLAVSGPLTDTQLRAVAVPVSGTVTSVVNYNEDSAHTSNNPGTFVLAVRNDALATLTSADLDYSPISVDSSGDVNTVLISQSPTGTSAKIEDFAHASGDVGSFVLGVRNDALVALTSANGDYSPVSVNAAGSAFIDSSASSVNPTKAEDAVHVSGELGAFVLAVRNDGAASMTSADGDYSPIAVELSGAIQTSMRSSATSAPAKAEDAVSTSGATGMFVLAIRRDADGTQVSADADYAEIQTDSRGAVRVNSVMRSATSAQSSVANSTSSVTALASNAARRGATLFNDDTAVSGASVKLKLGATASATSFSAVILPQGYYEVPFGYTGVIDAIASAATGNLRITELT